MKRENFKDNHVWLPKEFQIRERMFGFGIAALRKITEERFYQEFLKDEEKVKKIKEKFIDKEGDIMDVLALLFIMEYRFKKEWDFAKEEWVEIKSHK